MQRKITLIFDGAWVLSKREEATLPVDAFVGVVCQAMNVEVLSSTLTECELLVKDESLAEDALVKKVREVILEQFGSDGVSALVECSVSEYVPQQAPSRGEPETGTQNPFLPQEDDLEQLLQKVHSLIGAEDLKQLVDECVKMAPGLRKYNTVHALTHRSYLAAINNGNGYTTCLELFAKVLKALGLFRFDERAAVVEIKILSEEVEKRGKDPFEAALMHLSRSTKQGGRIISIDICEWMNKLTEPRFREFLQLVEDHIGENIYFFRVPFVEKNVMRDLQQALADILFVKELTFVPFDQQELVQCAAATLEHLGFTMEEDAWEIFNTRVTEEKNDGKFYGINSVNKIIREMIYQKQLHNAMHDIDDTVIKKDEILELAPTYFLTEKTGMDCLKNMIGMEAVYERVQEIVAQIVTATQNPNLGVPCIHMRFVGNPGTGKTTVARVIGQVLKEKGVLRNGNFFEHSGRDFCGRYVGETAPKTVAMCRDAYGSVLFVDEAYTLYRGDFHDADYGREAIDTLIAEMENHRSDLVVIMAGYPDEMNTLMKANAGLESRMPFLVEFPNYNREQLYKIFMLMVNRSFTYGEGFAEAAKQYFDTLPDEVIQSKDFSNARFVRNLFERTWGKAVLRTQLSKEKETVLTKEDFLLASAEKEFNKLMKKQSRTLGFV